MRNIAPRLASTGLALSAALLSAQSQSPKAKAAFFIQLTPERQTLQIGTKVKVKALITSTADLFDTSARGAMVGCSGTDLVHVEMEGGKEPEKTEFYRHLLGDFRPGDVTGGGSGSCFARKLNVGGTLPTTYDLSAFYQLTTPGRYEVWIEINDQVRDPTDGSVKIYPVRSNTTHFGLVSGR